MLLWCLFDSWRKLRTSVCVRLQSMRDPVTRGLASYPLAALLLFFFQAEAHGQNTTAPDSIETRMLACSSCHGLHGEGTNDPFFPRLAGKPAGYLYNQLLAFRNGRRHYSPMNYLLEFQSDAYLRAMAEYFAGHRPPFLRHDPAVVGSAVLEHGKDLVTHGDVKRGIPACVGCHNPALTGMEPAIPA
jgi:cytochrome c553